MLKNGAIMRKEFIESGKIVGTHGIRGMVRIQPWCDSCEFLCGFKKKGKVMKIIKNLRLFLFLAIILYFFSADEMKAATSYTDAKTFYDTCTNTEKHVEIIEDAVYYANKASVGNPAYKRFTTIGWQIRLTG